MKRFLLVLLTLSIAAISFKITPKPQIILVIFAHPDDENSIAQVLAKFSREGHKVYLIVATDGRLGTRRGFPSGDTLARLRQSETSCGCKLVGVQPPIFLGFPDGFDTRIGVAKYFDQSSRLKEQLIQKIQEINPDMIITFGPEGDTGHTDHRLIGAITTEVILKEGWVEKFPLYYLTWTKKDADKFKSLGLNTVDGKYANIIIHYSEQDEQRAMASLECYKSQLSADEIKEWVQAEKIDTTNVLYFRQLTLSTKRRSDF